MFNKTALTLAIALVATSAQAGLWKLKDPVDVVPSGTGVPLWYKTYYMGRAAFWVPTNETGQAVYHLGTFSKPLQAAKAAIKHYNAYRDPIGPYNWCYGGVGDGYNYCAKGSLPDDDPSWANNKPIAGWFLESMMIPGSRDHSSASVYYEYPPETLEKWKIGYNTGIKYVLPDTNADCAVWDASQGPFTFEISIPVEQDESASIMLDFGTVAYFEGETPEEGVWQLVDRDLDGKWDAENSFATGAHCIPASVGDTHQTCFMDLGLTDLNVMANQYGPSAVQPSGAVFWKIVNTYGPGGANKQPKDVTAEKSFGCINMINPV